jgi:carboxyl-terminal processing protease
MPRPRPPFSASAALCAVLLAGSALAFGTGRVISAQAPGPAGPSAEATAYLDAAFAILQAHFLHRDAVDWPTLRGDTLRQAGQAQTPVDTYPALRYALARLGDHHSYLQLTPALTAAEAARKPALVDPHAMPGPLVRKPTFPYPSPFRTRRVPEGALVVGLPGPVAQIVVPLFSSGDRTEIDAFATSIQGILTTLEASHPCGWVVDLRGNGGGNIWPMKAGLGPLLGTGHFKAAIDDANVTTEWFYEDGAAGGRSGATDEIYARARAPMTIPGMPPIAVLMDRDTGSSGEGVAIAFRGRPGTRFFGETTFGAATSTFPYALTDGAEIYLVTAVMVDRDGREYPAGVTPDEEILSEATISTADPVLLAAGRWASAQPGCRR